MIHYASFRTREGLTALQNVEDISTILESVHKPKGQEPITVFYLLLRNNNRLEVVGETRQSLKDKLCATGLQVIFHEHAEA